MKILYLGRPHGPTSGSGRAEALRRLGHDVHVVDPRRALPASLMIDWWCFHRGARGLARLFERYVISQTASVTYDLAFVGNGDLVSRSLVRRLKNCARSVVCFNQDNPFTSRDAGRWRLFMDALPEYDLLAFPRESSAEAARQRGARKVLRIWLHADERMLQPVVMTDEERFDFAADVSFVGSWMPERGPFMLRLVELGVPLRIFGSRWDKAAEYSAFSDRVTLGPLAGERYVKALASAKICLALLSKGNEDLHTSRSTEIPAIGRLLCGERTADHLQMYREDGEAVFFESPEECAEKCLALLADPDRLERIAAAGHRRALQNGMFSEQQLKRILDTAFENADVAS